MGKKFRVSIFVILKFEIFFQYNGTQPKVYSANDASMNITYKENSYQRKLYLERKFMDSL